MSTARDFRHLPADLPVPVDDGATDHLPGLELPELTLPSTRGEEVELRSLATDGATLVLYVYARTGTPGEVLEGWDEIPGARGCTPQGCAFRDHRAQLTVLGADIVGLSAQPPADQRDFAAREHIPFPLLSDTGLRLAEALDLPTFEFGGRTFYRRVTLVAREGVIDRVFYPVFPPDRDPVNVAAYLGAVS